MHVTYTADGFAVLQSGVSLHYCKSGGNIGGYKASIYGPQASCIALVEVAGKKAACAGNGIHVVQNHDAVVARYFFVYSTGSYVPNTMDTANMKIPAWEL